MKTILSILGSAFAGCTVGYVAKQVMDMQASPEGVKTEALVIGAPPITALLASLIGLVFGRSRASAFFAGAAITAAVGDRIDMSLPAMSATKDRLMSMAKDRPTT